MCEVCLHHIFSRVPVQATKGEVQDPHLPLQRQLPGCDLPRHPEGQVVPGPLHLQGPPLHLLPAQRLQPLGPTGQLNRDPVHPKQGGARQDCQAVDEEVRHIGGRSCSVAL